MAIKKSEEIISEASPHTIKKFNLIEEYVKAWAPKLLNTSNCYELVFIDCMCNSGEYRDKAGNCIYGTPVRVAKILDGFAKAYPSKTISMYFNDLSKEKVDYLSSLIKMNSPNCKINLSVKDGNVLLKEIANHVTANANTSYLLVYDPYEAAIDWHALYPYLNNWGEVIINHMLYDSTRVIKMAKSTQAIQKYEQTYLEDIEALLPYGSDKSAYEKRIETIIKTLRNKHRYYIASFPFFNSRNTIVYDLIHCTNSIVGFRLYKQVAWKVFGGKSSTYNTFGQENQLTLDLDNDGQITTPTFAECYYVKDIAEYLQNKFCGKTNVPLAEVWAVLDNHPIFPADGFRNEIKRELKNLYGAAITRSAISFRR